MSSSFIRVGVGWGRLRGGGVTIPYLQDHVSGPDEALAIDHAVNEDARNRHFAIFQFNCQTLGKRKKVRSSRNSVASAMFQYQFSPRLRFSPPPSKVTVSGTQCCGVWHVLSLREQRF